MRLQDFPRPTNDNGLGIHFGLDLRQQILDTYVPKMVELKMKWCLVAHQDELQLERAAQTLWSAGIMPVSRWICRIDQSFLDFVRNVTALKSLGIPAYVQIFNEPGDIREWLSGAPNFNQFVQRWIQHADLVADAGGLPGLQVLDATELRAVLQALIAANATSILERMWFCPHPYGANHPPNYPYDARNQQDHPGATIFDDNTSVLSFLELAPVFENELGFIPPFIAGEGGWQFGAREDNRYPAIDDDLHAQFHRAFFDAFATQALPHGGALPDYLFALCPWIFFGPEEDAWYSFTRGTRQKTIDAIKALPAFTRAFSWERAPRQAIAHYVLFGAADAPGARAWLLGARNYLLRFGATFGSDLETARNAARVTIVGDARAVNTDADAELQRAGCQVERIAGDQYAVDAALADRVARGAEFG
ncbi:MAG: hypothetical protein HY327_04090 [Chloroflexi bacterium]|nr:hypothetical protein [Chloroflexota bacterium]